ncbi:MAG: S-methyl-5-thioribose-1-phosphate isomerase [Lachnospiraceae bacterium]|nr:S-methyl-5-thioribose-1-phosphate isomerase [Lachnospiraceae bacterium]
MDIDTVDIDLDQNAVVIIDQTKLPNDIVLKKLRSPKEIWDAIYKLEVRGAPAIGVCAAFGIYVIAKDLAKDFFEDEEGFFKAFYEQKEYLDSSRPTAVNLSWALNRMASVLESHRGEARAVQVEALKDESIAIRDEDIFVCKRIGEYGVTLLKDGDGVLTHCNAGKLATVRYGTATSPIYVAKEKGLHIRVYCDETRPLLQGARLTAFELFESGVDTTLLCDNMSSALMKEGKVNAIFVGCDRVAANGDTANKIGTSVVAAVAKQYHIPMYIAAPTSTIDMNCKSGDDIVIEQRDGAEVTDMWYEKPMAPKGVKVFNPAFDVTDYELIAGIVTEYGIAKAPYSESLKEIFRKKNNS